MDKSLSESEILAQLDKAYKIRGIDISKSISITKDALEKSRSMDSDKLTATALNRMSLFLMITGAYEKSKQLADEAIALFEKIGDKAGIADAKYNLAGMLYKTDNHHKGLMYLLDCLSIYKVNQDYHNQARVFKSIATIYEYFNDLKRAIEAYKNTLTAAKRAKDIDLEANALNPLSGIYLNQNRFKEAFKMIERSIAIKNKTKDVRGLAFALYGRGKIYIKTKEYHLALRDLNASMEIHQKVGDKIGIAMCYVKLGELHYDHGKLDKAIKILKEAVLYGKKYNIALVKFKGNLLFYKVYKKAGNVGKSLIYLEKYIKEKELVMNNQVQKIISNYESITRIESKERQSKLQSEKDEIIRKKNIAEQANRVKQDFLSTMSHEIRTPLNAIITIASLLEKRENPQEQELIDSLNFSSNNLLLLINDILDFSKLEAGKFTLDFQPVDFNKLLLNIKNTYNSLAKEKGLALNLKVISETSKVYLLDETRISQILGNLISNSIKFTDQGYVDIIVDKVDESDESDIVRFKVIDSGTGIDKEYQKTIFDSFSQSKSVTKRKAGGSGLGLAIVKKLVELHNSRIHLISEEGRGSMFYFDLKLKKSRVIVKSKPKSSNDLAGKYILLAEDNMINAMVAKKLLSNWGIKTKHAKNGVEAFEMSQEELFDYILLDIHMPEMDGFEAVKLIRETSGVNCKTPIFALTADITVKNKEEYAGYFNDFLLKPIEKDKLYNSLKTFQK